MTANLVYSSLNNFRTSFSRLWRPNLKILNNMRSSSRDGKNIYSSSQKMKPMWNAKGPLKSLHSLNYLRLPYIRDALVKISPDEKFTTSLEGHKILEIGCGGGLLSDGLAKLGAEVTAIDSSKHLIDVAQYNSSKSKNLKQNSPTYYCTTIEEHSCIYKNYYDVVVVSQGLHHVVDQDTFIGLCVGAAKPGAEIFFTIPCRSRASQVYVMFINEKILKTFPRGSCAYDKLLRPNELKLILEMNDCFVKSIKGYNYYPLSNCWEWTNTKMFFFAIHAVKSIKN